jgi:NSS family neurotransmitter:Na+ symporter
MNEPKTRDGFTGTFGIIAATAGSAIGLGNIWRFPYVAGENGGGAFLLVYLFFVFGIGVPVMLSEMIIGRKAGANAFGSFKKLVPESWWWIVGLIGIAAAFIILAFYGTVAGWTMEYLFSSMQLNLLGQNYEDHFIGLMSGTTKPVLWHIVFMFLTAMIVIAGVKKGIEKYTRFLMPMLFVIIIILCIRSLTLPGAMEGIEFLFRPDFSKLTGKSVLDALGQAFFSLSIGMGTIITYASYIQKKERLSFIAVSVSTADIVLAILAGIMIFPAVFAFNIPPSSGPGLVFITLPSIFEQIPGGNFFAILFFLLLAIAALTSSISVLEVVVAFFTEELKIGRKSATIISSIAITILGLFCTLSWSTFKNVNINMSSATEMGGVKTMKIFDFMDFTASNILLPLGGLLIVLFVGWVLKKKTAILELSNEASLQSAFFKIVFFIIKFVAPIAIAFVFLNGIGLIK